MPDKLKLIAGFAVIILLFIHCKSKPHEQVVTLDHKIKNDSAIFRQLQGIACYHIGDSLYHASRWDSAMYYFKKALTDPKISNNIKFNQEVLTMVGHMYISLSDYEKAGHYLRKALDLISRNSPADIIDANTFRYAGILYYHEKESDSALLYINKALDIYIQQVGDNHIQVVNCNLNIGDVFRWVRFDYYSAEKYYYHALQIFENQHFDLKESAYFLILYSLATTNRLKQDYDKALSYGFRALQVAENVKNRQYIEWCNAMIANVYIDKSDFNNAIAYDKKAIATNSQAGGNYYLPLYLNNLAYANDQLTNYSEAFYYSNMALDLLKKQPDNFQELSNTYFFLGETYLKINQLPLALLNIKKCLTIRRKSFGEKHWETAYAYYLLGKYHEYKLDFDSALHYYQLAIINNSVSFNDPHITVNPLFSISKKDGNIIGNLSGKASVLRQKFIGNPKDTTSLELALKCYTLIDSLVSFSRKSIETEKSRLTLAEDNHELYENAIECAYQMYQLKKEKQYIEQAFRFFEKNKYLLLLEKLKMAEAANKTGIPDSLIETERKLNVELKLAQDKLADEQNNKHIDNAKILSLNAKVFKIVREIENLGAVFEKSYPNYFKVKYLETNIQLENLQALAQQKAMNIIQYFWGTNSIYVISVSGHDVNFTKFKNTPELRESLNNFIALLHKPDVTSMEKFRAYSEGAHSLYKKVLQPALEPLTHNNKQINDLTIIPDGLLTKLSFEVLTTLDFKTAGIDYKKLPYLIYQFNIQYGYSSSILIENSNTHRSRSINKLLGFGYAGLSDHSNKALPGTATEMEVIRNYFRSQEFLGQNETKENFIKKVADYDIIHLALHGTADEENETDTKLIFRKEKDSDNGLLYANEIYGLKLKAKLVVLSACETGIGKNYKGEGVFSVARAFSYAGCPSAVISLWKVNDQSTSDIMGNFYKFLSQGDGIGYSLREAKLEFLKNADEYSAHPAYWSSFVAFGDMSPLKSRKDLKIWLTILFITVVTAVAWRYRVLTQRHSKHFQNE